MAQQEPIRSAQDKRQCCPSQHSLPLDEQEKPSRSISPDSSMRDRHTHTYENNLIWAVGLLEWSNAMDFPANVFNQVPVPLYAQVLMGIGGSIAILWSIFPLLDLCRSLRNIRQLRRERSFLLQWRRSFDDQDSHETRCLVQALLDVNVRELGWECIDRVLMNICAGLSGVLVGTGALMAIQGDDPNVFQASNLLSGYVGNSFLAPFALANAIWSVFIWRRAGSEKHVLQRHKTDGHPDLLGKTASLSRRHRIYAVLNGTTAVVGTVGSIMSSTLWYGYVIIAPCVVTLLFCNLFWRYRLGYSRQIVQSKDVLRTFDIERALTAVLTIAAIQEAHEPFVELASPLQVRFCLQALGGLRSADSHAASTEDLAAVKPRGLASIAKEHFRDKLSLTPEQKLVLEYRQRHLLELYGRYIRHLSSE